MSKSSGITKRMKQYYVVLNKYKKSNVVLSSTLNNEKIEITRKNNIYIVNSLNQYVEFINNLMLGYTVDSNNTKYRRKFIFRGFNNIYLIKSKLFNQELFNLNNIDLSSIDFNKSKARDNIVNNDIIHIKKFEENGCLKLKGFTNSIDLVAAAEHYGITTRYIDWSHSPLVSTLFAIHDEPGIYLSDDEKYYCLMIRDYRNASLILKDLWVKPDNDEAFIKTNQISIKYAIQIKELEEIFNYRKELEEISIDIRKDFKTKNYILMEMKNDFKNAIEIYLSQKEIDLDKANKAKELIFKIYSYFEKIYSITNINNMSSNGNNEIAALMTRKFIALGSKLFLETNISNERLRNQRGLFEIDCFDSIIDQFKDDSNMFLLIKASMKKELIKYIDRMGINYYILTDEPEQCSDVINRTLNHEYSFSDKIEYSERKKK